MKYNFNKYLLLVSYYIKKNNTHAKAQEIKIINPLIYILNNNKKCFIYI